MNEIKKTLEKIRLIGIKAYLDSLFTRSFGRSIAYTDNEHVIITSPTVVFHMKTGEADYFVTVQDIVYLVRYVRFLSIAVCFLIFLVILLLIFRS